MTEYRRPLPVPSPESMPFWEGCRVGEFLLQRCTACSAINWFPRAFCLVCGGDRFEWPRASGTATLETYSIVYRAMNEAWKSEVPYTLAWVRLAEGPRMVTRLVHDRAVEPVIGATVTLVFEQLDDRFSLPFFRYSVV
ncbi:Zn-ribbon domain-containing OB-fold protein [Sphingomonas sp.]|uniref:Zn-ribbon domain-containing OB-fold protein n=1 Tax=Sphingomonas sp. TaxID=28214 RepID=UPI003B007495